MFKENNFYNEETKNNNKSNLPGRKIFQEHTKFEKYDEMNPKDSKVISNLSENESIKSPSFMNNYNRFPTQENNYIKDIKEKPSNRVNFMKMKPETKSNYTFDQGHDGNNQLTTTNDIINSRVKQTYNEYNNKFNKEEYSPSQNFNPNNNNININNNDINELTIKSYYQANNTNQSNSNLKLNMINNNNIRYRNTNSDDLLSTLSAMNMNEENLDGKRINSQVNTINTVPSPRQEILVQGYGSTSITSPRGAPSITSPRGGAPSVFTSNNSNVKAGIKYGNEMNYYKQMMDHMKSEIGQLHSKLSELENGNKKLKSLRNGETILQTDEVVSRRNQKPPSEIREIGDFQSIEQNNNLRKDFYEKNNEMGSEIKKLESLMYNNVPENKKMYNNQYMAPNSKQQSHEIGGGYKAKQNNFNLNHGNKEEIDTSLSINEPINNITLTESDCKQQKYVTHEDNESYNDVNCYGNLVNNHNEETLNVESRDYREPLNERDINDGRYQYQQQQYDNPILIPKKKKKVTATTPKIKKNTDLSTISHNQNQQNRRIYSVDRPPREKFNKVNAISVTHTTNHTNHTNAYKRCRSQTPDKSEKSEKSCNRIPKVKRKVSKNKSLAEEENEMLRSRVIELENYIRNLYPNNMNMNRDYNNPNQFPAEEVHALRNELELWKNRSEMLTSKFFENSNAMKKQLLEDKNLYISQIKNMKSNFTGQVTTLKNKYQTSLEKSENIIKKLRKENDDYKKKMLKVKEILGPNII